MEHLQPQAPPRLHSAHFHPSVLVTASRSFAGSADKIPYEITQQFKGHKIDPPSLKVETWGKEFMNFFRTMFVMRRMEIAADAINKQKLVRGFCHHYDSQEAVCVGMEASLTPTTASPLPTVTTAPTSGVAQTALGAGLAFAQKYLKVEGVTIAVYGDVAANQGQLFEAMNISALWELPVIYVCENNHCKWGELCNDWEVRIRDLGI